MYSREIEGQRLTLSASGWTYNYTFVLYDWETESMWYHLPGEDGLRCIAGVYADRRLPEFASTFGRWSAWYPSNTDTRFLNFQVVNSGD